MSFYYFNIKAKLKLVKKIYQKIKKTSLLIKDNRSNLNLKKLIQLKIYLKILFIKNIKLKNLLGKNLKFKENQYHHHYLIKL
jgi:hypothetical protein